VPVRDEADLLAGRVQEGLRGQRGVLASARKSLETCVYGALVLVRLMEFEAE
jgi:hypothetical protein